MNVRLFLIITAVPVIILLVILNQALNFVTEGWWFSFMDEYDWIAFVQFILGMVVGCLPHCHAIASAMP